MKTNKKGISLIVLAITIVVMIILASAIILSLSGKDVIGSAKEATSSSDIANAKHAVSVARGEWEIDPENKTFKQYAEEKLQEAGISGYNVSENGGVSKIYKDEANKVAYIPEGYIASEVEGENTIEGGLVIYEGYEAVTDRNVEEARKTRNQFVWVPVENEFDRIEFGKGSVEKSECESYDMSSVAETEEYAAMYNSVREHKGFYIARYESGKIGTDKLVIRKSAKIWDTISCEDAKEKCEMLSTNGAVGHLIYGEEWDAALNFIATRGVKDTGYATNSVGKGRYSTSKSVAGSKDTYAFNNIYDMAGNLFEWTMESYESDENIVRGGDYRLSGSDYPASYRYSMTSTYPGENYGFRASLYLK